jgi:hypothetical protein
LCKILDSKAHFGKAGREMLFQNAYLSTVLPNSLSQKAIPNSHILIKGKGIVNILMMGWDEAT